MPCIIVLDISGKPWPEGVTQGSKTLSEWCASQDRARMLADVKVTNIANLLYSTIIYRLRIETRNSGPTRRGSVAYKKCIIDVFRAPSILTLFLSDAGSVDFFARTGCHSAGRRGVQLWSGDTPGMWSFRGEFHPMLLQQQQQQRNWLESSERWMDEGGGVRWMNLRIVAG